MGSSAMAFGAQFLSDFRAARVTPTNLVLNVTLKCPLKMFALLLFI